MIYRRHLSSTRWNLAVQSVITHGQNLITQSGHYHHPNSRTGSSMTNMVKSNQALDQWSSTDEIFKPAYPLGHTWLAWPNCIIHFINDHTWLTWSNRIIHLIINVSQGKIVSSTWSFMSDMVKPDNPLDLIIHGWHLQTRTSTWSLMTDMVKPDHPHDHSCLIWLYRIIP